MSSSPREDHLAPLAANDDDAGSTKAAVPLGLGLGFFTLGLLNNLAYCVVLGGAKDIVDDFDSKNNIGFLVWANVALGIVVPPSPIPVALRGAGADRRGSSTCVACCESQQRSE